MCIRDRSHHHYQYPLIQYQVYRGQACIIAMGTGRNAIYQHLLPKLPTTLHFANQTHSLKEFNLEEKTYQWSIHNEPITYGLIHWLALNQNNYIEWKNTVIEKDRQLIFKRAITGHLRCFAESLGIENTNMVTGNILRIDRVKKMHWHGQSFVGFNAIIQSTLSLPAGPGLGRCVAFGFGEIMDKKGYDRWIKHRSFKRKTVSI